MADLRLQHLESGAVVGGLSDQPMRLVDRARQDGIRMQGIGAADQRALGEWAARLALGYETKNAASGAHHE